MDVARGALSDDEVSQGTAGDVGRGAVGPPQLPFVLTVGITGHRLDALAGEGGEVLRKRLDEALTIVTDSAKVIHGGRPARLPVG